MSNFYLYNQTSPSQLRIIASSDLLPFNFTESSPALFVYFKLKKFTGFIDINFDPNFRIELSRDDHTTIPHTTSNGSITYNDQQARTLFSPPTDLSPEGTTCTGLYSRGTAPLLGFDFNVDWDTTAFRLVDVGYADNPLGLRESEVAMTPTSLHLARDTSLRDTTPRLPYGVQLLELCFEPTALTSTSYLRIGRTVDPVFHLVFEDSLYSPAPYNLFPGSLYLRGEQARDTVKLEVGPPVSTNISDTLLCTSVRAKNYIDVSAFDFSVSWPEDLALAQVHYPDNEQGLVGTSLLAQSETSARFGLSPDEPVNFSLEPGTPLVELCFTGDFTPCDFYPIELAEQPDETHFDRRLLDLPGGLPLSYKLTSGYVYQEGGDALRIELETVHSDPDSSLHHVRMSTTSDVCTTDFPFLVQYDFSELGFDDVELAPEREGEFRIRRRGSPIAGAKGFALEREPGASGIRITPGEIATFTFTRRGTLDTVPIGLLPYETDTITVTREDGVTIGIPVFLTDGSIIFGLDMITGTRYFNSPQNPPLTVYPNPTSGIVNIEGLRVGSPVSVWIYDRSGSLLRRIQNPDDQVDLSGLPAGIFWLRVEQEGVRWMEKVIMVE
ncbi:T9SS type A sorting domain-containing protein [Neolewinella aurantiaca]|uniref:T9SS type A sorting domain-containing protein n=1 Tax=Neolewinella aurantiaca TaxID=2602767 RepID=UPI001C9CCC76|nr:T9SS type A sorting domain-containing protein [Neolewinella aurantiaca]